MQRLAHVALTTLCCCERVFAAYIPERGCVKAGCSQMWEVHYQNTQFASGDQLLLDTYALTLSPAELREAHVTKRIHKGARLLAHHVGILSGYTDYQIMRARASNCISGRRTTAIVIHGYSIECKPYERFTLKFQDSEHVWRGTHGSPPALRVRIGPRCRAERHWSFKGAVGCVHPSKTAV